MTESWENEAVAFDQIYSGAGLSGKIPFLGSFIQKGIIERQNRALAFLRVTRAQTIIDLGCGVGRFAIAAARSGAVVHAYDISQSAIELAREAAQREEVNDQCHFHVADLLAVDFPAADAWFDLGCLHYLPDPAKVIEKLTKVPHLFSCLPQKGHWLGPLHYAYRTLLRGLKYLSFTEAEIKKLLAAYPHLHIEKSGLVYYVTTAVAG